MNKPFRIQLRRTASWKLPPNTRPVARPGRWDNPFSVARFSLENSSAACRELVTGGWNPSLFSRLGIDDYRDLYAHRQRWSERTGFDPATEAHVDLRGKNLACLCRLCSVHAEGKPLG